MVSVVIASESGKRLNPSNLSQMNPNHLSEGEDDRARKGPTIFPRTVVLR